jgi:phosphomannomutase
VNTLIGLGIDVIDLGLSTTPTVEVASFGKQTELFLRLTQSNGMP